MTGYHLASGLYYQLLHGILASDSCSCAKSVLSMYARHVVKLFLNLLSINLRLSLALLVALDPRSQTHLYDRDPYYVATVIYVAVELVDLVEHSLVVLLSHPHVLLNHLNLFFESLDLNIIDLIVKFSFLVLLEFYHLVLGHLTLNLIDHF